MSALLEERISRVAAEDPSTITPSWYRTLSGLVISLIHQFIMMHLGYQVAGGRKDSYDFDEDPKAQGDFDKTNVAKLMMRIRMQLKPDTPFPIYKFKTLGEWGKHFNKVSNDADYLIADEYAVDNKMDRARTSEYRDLESGNVESYADKYDLEGAVETGHDALEECQVDIDTILTAAGVERDYFDPGDFLLGHLFPSASLHAPEWTPWLAAMASTNIYGQLSIMYRRICAVQNGTKVVAAAMLRRANALEEEKKHILDKAVEVRNAFRTIKKTEKKIAVRKTEISGLEREITETLEMPGVRRSLELCGDLGRDPKQLALYVINPHSTDCQRLQWFLRAQRNSESCTCRFRRSTFRAFGKRSGRNPH